MSGKFAYVKKGYDPIAVDSYIMALEVEVKTHRENDEIIRNAIVSAQQAADGIIQNAKNQGRHIREKTAKQLEDVAFSVSQQRRMLADFARDYGNIVTKYLKITEDVDFQAVNAKIDALENYLKGFSDEIHEDLEAERRSVDNIQMNREE